MADRERQEFYARRIQRVLHHVEAHLDEELSVERLAAVAGFSKYHFHRQFSAFTGMTVGRLVSLLRLKRASYQLAFELDRQIIAIGYAAGFSNPESFSRAFRAAQGQSPSEFRSAPRWENWSKTFQSPFQRQPLQKGLQPMDVRIVDFEPTPIAVLEHHGPVESLMQTVSRFIAWRKSCNDSPEATSRTFGIPHVDPDAVAPTEFRFDVCGSTRSGVAVNEYGVVAKQIPSGRCACVRHVGSTDDLEGVVRALYEQWLPNSGEELRDFPVFFHYVQRMPTVDEHQQVTDVFLPLV